MLDKNFNKTIELILMYLDIGRFLFDLQQHSKYGDKITAKAAEFMKNNQSNK